MAFEFDPNRQFKEALELTAKYASDGNLLVSKELEKIASVVKDVLPENISKLPEGSYQVNRYDELSNNLKTIADRVTRTKSWVWRILNFFGIFSRGERQTIAILKQVESLCSQFGKEQDHTYMEEKISRIEKRDLNLKGFFLFPRLESDQEENLDLAGGFFVLSYRMLFNELSNFIDEYEGELSAIDLELIKKALIGLQQGIEKVMSIHELIEKCVNTEFVDLVKVTSKFSLDFTEELKKLAVGESLTLPAGTSTHAIIYKITRESNEECTFKIYNTGQGAQISDRDKWKTYSAKFTHCPLNKVANEIFINNLVDFNVDSTKPIHTNRIIEYITNVLGKENEIRGDHYPLQVRGSCSLDSLMAYLKGSLPKPIFYAFQLYVTRKLANKVDTFFLDRFTPSIVEDLSLVAASTLANRESAFKRKVKKWSIHDPKTDRISFTALNHFPKALTDNEKLLQAEHYERFYDVVAHPVIISKLDEWLA
ncbi:MAG: hypothetical protein P4L16_07920 [Chlamydiales bacterium]|nr:hypothetical protein [Chlamydiales bacterium]